MINNLFINIPTVSLFIACLIDVILIVLISLKKNKTLNNIFFILFSFSVFIWVFSRLIFDFANSYFLYFITYSIYFGAALIPLALLFFIYTFPKKPLILSKRSTYLLALPAIIIAISSYIPNFIIKTIDYDSINMVRTISFGSFGYYLYFIYIVIYFLLSIIKMIQQLKITKGNEHSQLEIIFSSIFISAVVGVVFNLVLPTFGYFNLFWVGPLFSIYMVLTITYAIIKYQLFDPKLIATEGFVFLLWILIFIRAIFSTGIIDQVINYFLLISFIIIGIYLIKNILKEVSAREKIEELAQDLQLFNSTLEQKVAEQTEEIRYAFELEKKAKRDLEKLNETKDQFIMITQHNLRTPITSIRWELEAMLSGTYGAPSTEMIQALKDTDISVKHLTRIVDDFLNITAIKAGSQILRISSGSLKQSLEDVLIELKIDIEDRKITVDYPNDIDSWPILKIDENKMREVILIIIENAIRYNIENGKIVIINKIENNNFVMTIENTGIGIINEDKNNLFNKLFFRSKRAQTTNPNGMGIGLFVSRAILRAHHGDIKIFSEGENKGATVTLTLPLNFLELIENIN